eukprot:TRINITY_DN24037_c0_g2_i1.p1 TRINITY_DN24037_c0_g2~~TRINITY_DN24037_c0_g2_i1.p1  ORF type:complete len:617 (-),score=46.82 TRINITY_DN24037_c0_g2_i1:193-2043(-)
MPLVKAAQLVKLAVCYGVCRALAERDEGATEHIHGSHQKAIDRTTRLETSIPARIIHRQRVRRLPQFSASSRPLVAQPALLDAHEPIHLPGADVHQHDLEHQLGGRIEANSRNASVVEPFSKSSGTVPAVKSRMQAVSKGEKNASLLVADRLPWIPVSLAALGTVRHAMSLHASQVAPGPVAKKPGAVTNKPTEKACVPEGSGALLGVFQFYGAFYFILAAACCAVRYDVFADTNQGLQTRVKQRLKAIATHLNKYPLLRPSLYCFCFFTLADAIAQSLPAYWCTSGQHFDIRSSIAVGAASALFHGLVLGVIQRKCDALLAANPRFATNLFLKMLCMLAMFLVFYLPLATLLFDGVAGCLFRLLVDLCESCLGAAFANVPGNTAASLSNGLATERLKNRMVASVLFWSPSHIFTYLIVSEWSPEARAPADAIIAVLWNLKCVVLARKNGLADEQRRTAVGPLLTGLVSGPEVSVPARLDCNTWSGKALMGKMFDFLKWMCIKLKEFAIMLKNLTIWILTKIKEFTIRTLKCIWFVICSILRSLLTLVRIALYISFMLIWKIIGFPFRVFDAVKWYAMMFFIPTLFPYDREPYSMLWPWSNGQKDSSFLCCNPFSW